MRLIFSPASISAWKDGLARPKEHWVRKKSAFELAITWEGAAKNTAGLPANIAALLDQQIDTKGANLLLAIPEHKVEVPGRGFPSQTDLWALLKNGTGLISLAVEGKAGEPFDKRVEKWLSEALNNPTNREFRLDGLCQKLKLPSEDVGDIFYQLIHRSASAVLEAERYGAPISVFLVQSFGESAAHFDAFQAFADRMGAPNIQQEQLLPAHRLDNVRLYIGWTNCRFATDAEVAQAAFGLEA